MQKQHLNELLEHGIITPEVATAITNYYQNKQTTASKLPIIFGIFGALLGGLGIILLIGHNWDDFSTTATDAEIAGFVRAVGHVAREMGLVETGYRLLANIGGHGHQEVPHLHVHVFAGRPLGPMLAR